MCQDLNCHLSGRVFLTGYKLSLADILLYYGLHRYMVSSVFLICITVEPQGLKCMQEWYLGRQSVPFREVSSIQGFHCIYKVDTDSLVLYIYTL